MKASIFLAAICVLACSARASDFHRAGTFEIGGVMQGYTSQSVDGHLNGVPGNLEFDDMFAGGINFGYHLTDYLNVNTDLIGGEGDLRFSSGGVELRDDAPLLIWTVNLDYYILPTRFTPYLSAGIGLLSMDNELDDDYWCYCYPRDREIPINEIDFFWNVGAGLRWDPIDHLYIKLGYRLSGTELEYADEHMFLHSVMLTVGYTFHP